MFAKDLPTVDDVILEYVLVDHYEYFNLELLIHLQTSHTGSTLCLIFNIKSPTSKVYNCGHLALDFRWSAHGIT